MTRGNTSGGDNSVIIGNSKSPLPGAYAKGTKLSAKIVVKVQLDRFRKAARGRRGTNPALLRKMNGGRSVSTLGSPHRCSIGRYRHTWPSILLSPIPIIKRKQKIVRFRLKQS